MMTEHAPWEHIRNLSLIVFGYRRTGHRIMAFFTSYWDASGKSHDPFMVLSGYVAPADRWGEFVEEWSAVLRRENLTIWHMKDFVGRRREYQGWTDDRCSRVYPEMIDIIKKHRPYGVVSAIEVETYKKLVTGEKLRLLFGKNPYKFCLLNCMAQVKEWLVNNHIQERVAYVVERGDDGYGEAKEAFDELYGNETMRREYQLGTLTAACKEDPAATPCQAADILSWECRKEIVEKRKTTPRNPRLSLESLLLSPHADVFWDRETLPLFIALIEKSSNK